MESSRTRKKKHRSIDSIWIGMQQNKLVASSNRLSNVLPSVNSMLSCQMVWMLFTWDLFVGVTKSELGHTRASVHNGRVWWLWMAFEAPKSNSIYGDFVTVISCTANGMYGANSFLFVCYRDQIKLMDDGFGHGTQIAPTHSAKWIGCNFI